MKFSVPLLAFICFYGFMDSEKPKQASFGSSWFLAIDKQADSATYNPNLLVLDSISSLINKSEKRIINSLDKQFAFKDFIPIIVAFIAGFLALLQVKSNVIITAKIKLVDSFYNNLSEYLSLMEGISSLVYLKNYIEKEERLRGKSEKYEEEYKKILAELMPDEKRLRVLNYQIRFELRRNEPEEAGLEQQMDKYLSLLRKMNSLDWNEDLFDEDIKKEIEKTKADILDKSKNILEAKWKKAKEASLKELFAFRI